MYRLNLSVVLGMLSIAACLLLFRGYFAVADLIAGDQTQFLAFPLTVILPSVAYLFLASRRDMTSQGGALMQLGAMFQILLIIALPSFALYLALGFPVVFLLVELFETKMPLHIKTAIKGRLMV